MSAKNKTEKPQRRFGAFRLFLIVIILLLVPTTLDQLNANRDIVLQIGRVCVGIAVLLFLYGLFAKVIKVVGFVLVALIVVVALANEGVIQLPNILNR